MFAILYLAVLVTGLPSSASWQDLKVIVNFLSSGTPLLHVFVGVVVLKHSHY